MKNSCKEARGINEATGGVTQKRDCARVHKAWSRATVDVKLKVDAASRARSERVTFLAADLESLISQFKQVHSVAIDETKLPKLHDSMLPSQPYSESFQERLHCGRLEAETLAHVVFLRKEESQINMQPDQPKQLGITLDSNVTIQTRKRYTGCAASIGALASPKTRNGPLFGPLFSGRNGSLGFEISMQEPNVESFSWFGPLSFGVKKRQSVSIRKIIEITQWIDQKSMSFDTSSLKNVLLT